MLRFFLYIFFFYAIEALIVDEQAATNTIYDDKSPIELDQTPNEDI